MSTMTTAKIHFQYECLHIQRMAITERLPEPYEAKYEPSYEGAYLDITTQAEALLKNNIISNSCSW